MSQKPKSKKKPRDLHSRVYRRYFAQHEEVGHLDEKGRVSIERIYRGSWTVQLLDDAALRRERALLALLYVLAAAAFVFAALRDLPGNRTWYLSAAHVLAFAFLAWTLVGLFNYCSDGARMTVGEYRCGALRFRQGSLLSGAALGACALLYLLCAALFKTDRGGHLFCAALSLAAAALLLLARRTDLRVPCETIENTAELPPTSD
ncbi:MAG: hypothetical protein IJH48_08740 [Oscillospiraceae bacterium]|nr:hypothetical protein [Oscillospiraceae bacterium]